MVQVQKWLGETDLGEIASLESRLKMGLKRVGYNNVD
jgi:hypothetical protein